MTNRFARTAPSSGRQAFRATVWCFVPVICAIFAGRAFAQQESPPQTPGTIFGIVKDPSGATIAGAVVTLQAAGSTEQRTAIILTSFGMLYKKRANATDHPRN